MNVKLIAAILVFVLNFHTYQTKRYDNYVLYQVLPTRKAHLIFLQRLDRNKYMDVQFWTKPYRLYNEIQFIAAPNETETLMERTAHFRLPIEVVMPNIQKAFDEQTVYHTTDSFTWKHYHSLDSIYTWLNDITVQYPTIVNLELIGRSAEDREIFAVGVRRNREISKPKVIIEAGTHGQEWIGPMFATYIINQLINIHQADDIRLYDLAESYDWFIIPVVNPDGYAYTQKEDRLWRKNRRVTQGKHVGVDLNKNFNYSFGLHDASLDPDDNCYCGPAPFSEPESAAVANFIIKNGINLRYFFSIHSYGQMIILPYSDSKKRLSNYYEIENYAKQAIVRIYRNSGTKYAVGSYFDMIGLLGSGDILSWVKQNFKPRYAAELVLRDDGKKGFALPPKDILPTCRETMLGLVEIMTAKPKTMGTNMFRDNKSEMLSSEMVLLGTITMIALLFAVEE